MIPVVLAAKLTPAISRPPLGLMPGAGDRESTGAAASGHAIRQPGPAGRRIA